MIVAAFLFVPCSHAGRFLPHRAHLTTVEKVAYFKRSLRHERQVVAWLASADAPRTLERRSQLGWYRAAVRWHSRLLAQYEWKLVDRSDLAAWLCIHSKEGDWQDGGNPFWGGVQMNWSFMHSYGADMLRKYGEPHGFSGANGWANPWTPAEQIMVARRARDSGRGYYPWPNTARACGLI